MSRSAQRLCLALFGEPLEHSCSPQLQQAHADWLGAELSYSLLPSSAEGFASALSRARALGVSGANVTAPHKERAALACSQLSERARALGVVNTLSWGVEGELIGHNTDVDGLCLSFERLTEDLDVRAPRALRVIGAGGSARAVAWAALERGFERLELVARRPEATQRFSEWFEPLRGSMELKLMAPHEQGVERVALIALATPPLGLEALESLLEAQGQARCQSLLDLNYGARAELSRSWATRHRLPYQDGLLMLAEQGRRSFERWTGALPPLECSLKALAAGSSS